ncbi:uncharacterized protein LOC111023629 [Momordica charantia]|uniref:Uncharacterized protein LOC111023629 n=1 Tax=Momordica charantia TaxID=3673 RepID=A0A6J1DRC3_MOMCH|nr:uncharacterized protein LOC111023629 [Momordica charantia]
MRIKCIYEIKAQTQTPPFKINNDSDLRLYLMGEDVAKVPLYISFQPRCRGLTEGINENNKGEKLCYKSISESNQVEDLNPNVLIPMDALYDITVPFGWVDERNETSRWESYDSHDDNLPLNSFDDRDGKNYFNWESYNNSQERNENVDWEALMETKCDYVPKVDRKVNYESKSTRQKTYMGKTVSLEGRSTNDEFEVGNLFFNKRELFMKLSIMAMNRNFEFRVKKSTKQIFYVTCTDNNCKWRMRAVRLDGSEIFKISKYVNFHSCSLHILNHDHRQAKAWIVEELIKSKYSGIGRQCKPKEIIEDMRQDYGINMSYEKAWRAREFAYMRVRGSPVESYNLSRRYGEALKLANPDDNNQIYLIAFGIVDRETDNSIKWFLEKLKGAIGEFKDLVFVSDRNSSISKSIASVFPNAFHCICIHHLKQNLNAKFKNETIEYLFVNAAKAYRESKFREFWSSITTFDNGVGTYLEEVGLSRWARTHCPKRRYNMMTTNIAESMNALLKEARELPVTPLLEHVRALLQRWFWERRDEASKLTSTLTKWVEEIV